MTAVMEMAAWKALQAHCEEIKDLQMRELFEQEPERFDKFSLRFNDFLLARGFIFKSACTV